MNRPTVEWLVTALNAVCSASSLKLPVQNISIDSRSLQSGDLFWAIKAARDGHEFVEQAFSKGAYFAVVSKDWGQTSIAEKFQDRLIQVDDTFQSLTHAAHVWRRNLQIPVIAITGSNGKTSTKDILIHLLKAKYRTTGTTGNKNNELGLPLTLLSISQDDEIAVIEMGAAKKSDINYLCKIAEPTHGLITSISKAHLAGFKTIENIAKTKGELYDYLSESGVGFVPVEEPLCLRQSEVLSKRFGYGFCKAPLDWNQPYMKGMDYQVDKNGCGHFLVDGNRVTLPYPGKPIAQAALAALSIADHFHVPLAESTKQLSTVSLTSGRVSVIHLGNLTILDDSYNANPMSMQAALETLASMPGHNKAVILGDMNELGDYEEEAHRELGKRVAELKFSKAIFVGPLSRITESAARSLGMHTSYFASYEYLEPELSRLIENVDMLLIKASRTIGLDRVAEKLKRLPN